jgi:hypothetical protein
LRSACMIACCTCEIYHGDVDTEAVKLANQPASDLTGHNPKCASLRQADQAGSRCGNYSFKDREIPPASSRAALIAKSDCLSARSLHGMMTSGLLGVRLLSVTGSARHLRFRTRTAHPMEEILVNVECVRQAQIHRLNTRQRRS